MSGIEDLGKAAAEIGGGLGEVSEIPEISEGGGGAGGVELVREVQETPEVPEVEDNITEQVLAEVDIAAGEAEAMLGDYAKEVDAELPPEEASDFVQELGDVNAEIKEATEEFKNGVAEESSQEPAEKPFSDIEEEKSKIARQMSAQGEGENLPGNIPDNTLKPEDPGVEKPVEPQEEVGVAGQGNFTESKPENSQEYPEGMAIKDKDGRWLIYENRQWVDAGELDDDTQGFVNEKGFDDEYPGFSAPFTQEERQQFNDWFEQIYGRGSQGPEGAEQSDGGFAGNPGGVRGPEVRAPATEAAEALEEREARELMKLLLRVAIKVSVTVAAIVAKNIAKSLQKEDPELAAVVGAFGDIVAEGGKFADTVVSGEKGASLGEDIYKYFTERRSGQQTES